MDKKDKDYWIRKAKLMKEWEKNYSTKTDEELLK